MKYSEPLHLKILFMVGPLGVAALAMLIGLSIDIANISSPKEKLYWFQKSGSFVVVGGTLLAFFDVIRTIQLIGKSAYINTKLPYKYYSLALLIIGAIISGYGDVPFR